jgi:hypothetical protein
MCVVGGGDVIAQKTAPSDPLLGRASECCGIDSIFSCMNSKSYSRRRGREALIERTPIINEKADSDSRKVTNEAQTAAGPDVEFSGKGIVSAGCRCSTGQRQSSHGRNDEFDGGVE